MLAAVQFPQRVTKQHVLHTCMTLSKIETMPASFFFFKQLHVMQVACYEVKIEGSEKAGVQLPGVKLRTLLA